MRSSVVRSSVAALMFFALAVTSARSQSPLPKGSNLLFGRLLDIGTDAPIAGAAVRLVRVVPDPPLQLGVRPPDPPSRTVMTGADGYFVFRELAAGPYSIAAVAFGYGKNEYPPHLLDVNDSDKPANIVMRLWKQGAISG